MLLSISACSQGRSHPPSSVPEPADKAAVTTEVESWLPQVMSGSRQYSFRDSSVVSINNDTTARVLPIQTTMSYSVIIMPVADSFSISGKVDSSTIISQLQTRAATGDSVKVNEFHAALSKRGELRLSSQQHTPDCTSSSNSAASRIYELILPYPKDRIKVGDRWSDTVSSTSCHGRTPLTQQVIRNFEVKKFLTWHEQNAVEVQRLATITFSGASTETNTHLRTNGSGSGEATLLIDRNTVALLESNSQTKSMLTIVTSRGEFPFTQVTSTHIMIK
jgi:hypothetical protein